MSAETFTVLDADGNPRTVTINPDAYVTVVCLHGSLPWRWQPGTPVPDREPLDCTKHAYRHGQTRPADFYTNPRYGQTCECCGHQGTHRVDTDAIPESWPVCVQAYGLDVCKNWRAR